MGEKLTFEPDFHVVETVGIRNVVYENSSQRTAIIKWSCAVDQPAVRGKSDENAPIDLNRSCPAVSQICNRTLQSSTMSFLVKKLAPIVDERE